VVLSAARRGRVLPYLLLSPLVVFIGALSFVLKEKGKEKS